METGRRVKLVSLRGILTRYFLLTGCGLLALLAAWWIVLMILMNSGFIYPADAQYKASVAAVQAIESTGVFDENSVSPLCRWAVTGEDGEILRTNMDEAHLEKAKRHLDGRQQDFLGIGGQMYLSAALPAGEQCLFQYDYSPQYGSARLRELLPDFQTCYLIFGAVLAVAVIATCTRRYARLLAGDAALLARESTRVAARELEGPPLGRARIREFAEALEAIDTLKESLSRSLKEQWRGQQERADAMAALAHDLKTPLTVISGNAELLEEELPEKSQQREWAQAIGRNAGYASDYVARLRELAVDGGRQDVPRPVDGKDFLRELETQGSTLCRAKGVRFVCMGGAEGRWNIRRNELLRALTNVIENAARYAPPGSEVRLECSSGGGWVRFCVTDNGPGFSQEALARAAQPFFTEDASRGRQDGHMGLGLSFAEQVARGHGGTLRMDNVPQGGARVELSIQCALVGADRS